MLATHHREHSSTRSWYSWLKFAPVTTWYSFLRNVWRDKSMNAPIRTESYLFSARVQFSGNFDVLQFVILRTTASLLEWFINSYTQIADSVHRTSNRQPNGVKVLINAAVNQANRVCLQSSWSLSTAAEQNILAYYLRLLKRSRVSCRYWDVGAPADDHWLSTISVWGSRAMRQINHSFS